MGKDTSRDMVEESQAEQRTDRFKSERFENNEQPNDTTTKDWRNAEGERRGRGRAYRGRGRFDSSQQEWRDSSKLEESLSDPTHVPRLGQFFEVSKRVLACSASVLNIYIQLDKQLLGVSNYVLTQHGGSPAPTHHSLPHPLT